MPRPRRSRPARVVGVGCSAAALRAVVELLGKFPRATGFAFVLLAPSPDEESELRRGLEAEGIQVAQAKDGQALAADGVFLAPAGREVALTRGRFKIRPASERTQAHLVDFFLVSLAREYKARCIGVLLAGPTADGAQGIAAVRAQRGITFAQDPGAAAPNVMPSAAIATGAVDFVLAPRLIREELVAISKLDGRRAAKPAAATAFGDDELLKSTVDALRRVTGADFSHYKRSTLIRRIQRRMAVRRIANPAKYASLLSQSPAEARSLHDEVLIHVTSFFRDPEAFDALAAAVFEPLLKAKARNAPIRLWVPGCSTGEEVYSLAIALLEFLETKGSSLRLQLFGTDVSEKVVAYARRGAYPSPEVPAGLLKKYFVPTEDGQYQVCRALRELCVFAAHDLTRDPPYSNLDLISCRNVLIYFDQALQERVVPIFHYALAAHGVLMLGPSESIEAFKDLFSPVEKARHLYAKRPAAARLPPDMLAGGRVFLSPRADQEAAAPAAPSLAELSKEADRLVLTSSAPGVLVSEALDILQFRGDVGKFLTPSPGKAAFNLGKMAHEGLLFPVTRAIQQAKKTRLPAVQRDVAVKAGGGTVRIQVQVVPLSAPAAAEAYFLVSFADPAAALPKDAELLEEPGPQTKERHIARELQATKRALESIIDKQQTTNEELQSANEELRSRNEEYQSSLEEIQTAHEELQSANEELATLNEELRKRTAELDDKNVQLTRANEELRRSAKDRGWLAAIVDSSEDAIISKDVNGVITSWNRGAQRLFGYTAEEAVGKPVTILIPEERLEEEPRILLRIRRGQPIRHFETVRRRKDGSLVDISLTISPIYDDQGELVGISKVARDITDRKRADQKLEQTVAERTIQLRASNEELEAFCYAVAHDLRAPLRGIRSYSQLIQRRLKDSSDEQVRQDFQRIIDDASKMAGLIDGLLDLSRLTRQQLKLETTDLSALAESIAKDLKRAHPERSVRFLIEPGLKVRADPQLMRALLQNLLENSWKFTSRKASAVIEFGADGQGGEQVLFVRDDGAGFDSAYAGKLFNAFQRLHHEAEFSGTGIGLATAKRIVTRHGGRIWAEGQVDRGAAFFFTIPEPQDGL